MCLSRESPQTEQGRTLPEPPQMKTTHLASYLLTVNFFLVLTSEISLAELLFS